MAFEEVTIGNAGLERGGDMKKKQGLLYLLERSAELLERSAEEIWISHTIAGRWPKDDKHGARRDFNELCAMAKGLRKAHKYHKPNPLGGPAKMFDAIADRMRAGDSVKECMADYGLKFKRSNPELSALPKAIRLNDLLADRLAGN